MNKTYKTNLILHIFLWIIIAVSVYNLATYFTTNSNKNKEDTELIVPLESIDLNYADKEDLMEIGIPPRTAEHIIEYRDLNGDYEELEDLLNVKGIGDTLFKKWSKYLYVY